MNKKIIIWVMVLLVLIVPTMGANSWDTPYWEHFWSMDASNITGVNLYDSIATKNGTIKGGAVYNASGKINGALNFDGIDDRITFTPTALLNPTNNFSITLWFNNDNLAATQQLLNHYAAANNVVTMSLFTTEVSVFLNDGSTRRASKAFADTGNWHMLGLSWNTDTNTITGNLDGVSFTGGASSSGSSVNGFNIGRRTDGDRYFKGTIDEINIWSSVLTTSQFSSLYNHGLLGLRADSLKENFTATIAYPINETTYYGDYNGQINISLSNVNGSATCTINDSRWVFSSNDNTTYSFVNNTDITGDNISLLVQCSDLQTTKNISFWFYIETILDIYVYNEDDLQLLDQNIRLDLISNAFTGNYTFKKNTSIQTLPAGEYELSYNSDGFSQRQAYIDIIQGKKHNITLYLLNSSVGTQIIGTLYDEFGKETGGFYIKTYRRILGNYYLVETSRTNTDGQTDFFAVLNTPMYYFIIEDGDGVLYKQTEETEIYGTTAEFNIQITPATGHIFEKVGDYAFSLTFDNTTNIWTYIFNDRSGTSTTNKLAVYKYSDRSLIAQNQTSATSGILTINMNSLYKNGTTYLAIATANASPEFGIDARTFTYAFTPPNIKQMGLLITIILVVLMAFIGFWNPAVMLIMEAFTVLLTRIAQLHTLEYSTTIIITVLLFIIAYVISDKT